MPGDEFLEALSYARRHPITTTRMERQIAALRADVINALSSKDAPTVDAVDLAGDLFPAEVRDARADRNLERNAKKRKDAKRKARGLSLQKTQINPAEEA